MTPEEIDAEVAKLADELTEMEPARVAKAIETIRAMSVDELRTYADVLEADGDDILPSGMRSLAARRERKQLREPEAPKLDDRTLRRLDRIFDAWLREQNSYDVDERMDAYDGDRELVIWRPQPDGGLLGIWLDQPFRRLTHAELMALIAGPDTPEDHDDEEER